MKLKIYLFNMESYSHKYAKQILAEWLKNDYLRIDFEVQFCFEGRIYFIPDLVCYDENGISAIYEIVNKHELDAKKLSRMQFYFYISDTNIKIYEISSHWIMAQIGKPKKLKVMDFSMQTEPF